MKGVVVKQAGGSPIVVDDIKMPEPGEGQVLVKSIYAAINPVDGLIAASGLLLSEWPYVLGCDAGGIVTKTGPAPDGPLGPLKVGDVVFGCSRVAQTGYGTCQEYFLMDSALTVKKPDILTTVQAATVGVGLYTAALGVFECLDIPVPEDVEKLPAPTGEWALVLGGASSVGKFALQLFKVLGYNVLATCSSSSSELLKSLGAEATIDYKKSPDDILKLISQTTEGKLTRVFDAVGTNNDFVKALYKTVEVKEKRFTSTNDWDNYDVTEFSGAIIKPISIGPIGRPGAAALNATMTTYVPIMYGLLESGALKPAEYQIIGSTGFDSVVEAYQYQQGGKGGSKKVVVKLQDE